MNFSSSLMSGMGISLGGLEIATDFLYANPEFYEPDLTEIKTNIYGKKTTTAVMERPVRPTKSRESIINKFNILQTKQKFDKDFIIEETSVVKADEDFDFSFDDIEINENKLTEEEEQAKLLMQAIQNNQNNTVIEEEEEIDLMSQLDEIDDLEDEEESDEMSLEEQIDNLFDEDDLEDEEEVKTPVKAEPEKSLAEQLDSFFEDEEDEEVEEETEMSLEEQLNSFFDEDEEDDEEEEDSDTKSLAEQLDDFFEDEPEEIEEEIEIPQPQQVVKSEPPVVKPEPTVVKPEPTVVKPEPTVVKPEPTVANNTDSHSDEIEQMRKQMANMEKQIQAMSRAKATKSTSNSIDSDFSDVNIGQTNQAQASDSLNPYEQYNNMTIDTLYASVKNYMIAHGVGTRPLPMEDLVNKFGSVNIKKLIQKSYLIKIGKGVTVGR